MKKQLRQSTRIVSLLTCAVLFAATATINGQTICNNGTGSQGGYTYEYWKDNGSGCMTLGSGGTFSIEWSNIGNLLARKGLRPGSMNQVVTYGANYQPNGNSYLCVYGWTTNPLVEYYIVDSWGSWRPPGGEGYMGSVSTDGGTYDIYRTQRVNQPSIEGTATFYQYWSVRTSKRTSGTITCGNHFNAWQNQGMNMGNLYEVSFCVEGYQSSGSADVYSMSMSTGGSSGGSSSGGSSSGGSSSGGSSSGGNSGSGDYTVTVRARGTAGGEHLNVRVNNQVQAEINLSTSWQEYDVYVNAGDLDLEFDNDGGSRDVQVDWIQVHGETRQAEDQSYNTAVYQNGSCGGEYSEMMHCNGRIGFGDITYNGGGSSSGGSSSGGSSSGGSSSGGSSGGGSYEIAVRARGTNGSEQIQLKVGGSTIATWTLNTYMATRTATTSNSGGIVVEFVNDASGRDVQVDYIQVGGNTLQAENQSTNTGVWQNGSCGGSNSEWLHCSGYIGFSAYKGAFGDESLSDALEDVVIYPNPVQDVLNIAVPANTEGYFDAVIYSTSGAVLRQFAVQEGLNSIDLSELSKGMYIIKLTVNDQTITQKIFK